MSGSGPGQQNGQQGAESVQKDAPDQDGLDLQRIADNILSTVRGDLNRVVNQAVTSHLRRMRDQTRQRLADEGSEGGDDDNQGARPGSKSKKGGDEAEDEVSALRRRLEQIERERKREHEEALKIRRESDLRQAVSTTGTPFTEELYRYLVADPALKVGKDGNYYAVGEDGEHLSVQEFAKKVFLENEHWHPKSGRQGPGSEGPPARGGAARAGKPLSRDEWTAKLQEVMKTGDEAQILDFYRKTAQGEIAADGVNATTEED